MLRLYKLIEVRFTHPNSFGNVLGFSGEYNGASDEYDRGGKRYGDSEHDRGDVEYESDKEITSVFGGVISVENTYINNQESNFVSSFNQQRNEKSNNLFYYPIKDKIKDFKVELKDKDNDNNVVCLDNFHLKFHIKN